MNRNIAGLIPACAAVLLVGVLLLCPAVVLHAGSSEEQFVRVRQGERPAPYPNVLHRLFAGPEAGRAMRERIFPEGLREQWKSR